MANWDEVLAKFSEPTFYERQHNIKIVGEVFIIDAPDFKLLKRYKDDTSETLIILYRPSRHKPDWVLWLPSESQFNFLEATIRIYKEVDSSNPGTKANLAGCD